MAPPGIVADTDYLVVESTYGNRQRPAGDPMAVLGQVICDTAARGGGVIPAFAVGRAKALLYYLPLLKASSAIPASLPIFVDSQSFNLLARTRVIDKVALPLFCARCSVTDGAKRTDTARAM
jgi:Cft2 family RNA processing exonuclease